MDEIAAQKIFWEYNPEICYDCADKYNDSDSKYRFYFMFNDIIKSLNLSYIGIEKESSRFYVKLNNRKRIYFSELVKRYWNNNNFNIGKFLYKNGILYEENKIIIDIVNYICKSIQDYAGLVAFSPIQNIYQDENSLSFLNEYSGINPKNYDIELIKKLNLFKRPKTEKESIEKLFSLYLRKFNIYENIKIEFTNQEDSIQNFVFLVKRGNEYFPIGYDNLGIEPSKIYFYFVLFLFNNFEYLKSFKKLNIFNLICNEFFISQKNNSLLPELNKFNFDDEMSGYNKNKKYINVNENNEFLKLKVLEGLMQLIEENQLDTKLNELEENDALINEIRQAENNFNKYFKELEGALNKNFEENAVLRSKIDSYFSSIIDNNLINWKKILELISFFVSEYFKSLYSDLLPSIKIKNYLDKLNIKYKIKNDTINFFKNINGVESNISNFGSGLKNFLRFKIFMETISISRTNISFIEEPEINLHPNKIKELTEIFVDKLLNIIDETKSNIDQTILIETHSEYFLRNLQYIIASTKINLEKYIVIQYFSNDPTSENYIKEITIKKDGFLSDDFGPGFFDEAAILLYKLYINDMEEK